MKKACWSLLPWSTDGSLMDSPDLKLLKSHWRSLLESAGGATTHLHTVLGAGWSTDWSLMDSPCSVIDFKLLKSHWRSLLESAGGATSHLHTVLEAGWSHASPGADIPISTAPSTQRGSWSKPRSAPPRSAPPHCTQLRTSTNWS